LNLSAIGMMRITCLETTEMAVGENGKVQHGTNGL
jgi:hypothetical protein